MIWKIVGVLSLFAICSIYDNWILEHWDSLKWPVFAVIVILAAFNKKPINRADGRNQMNRIFEEHAWVRAYFAIYGLIIAIGTCYILYNGINISQEVSFFEFASAIGLLFVPVAIIRTKEEFIKAGKENGA